MQKPQPTSAPKSETRTEQNRLISLFLTSALAAILALGLMIPMAACQWLEQLAGPATTVYATSSDGTASTVLTAHNNQYDSTSLPVWLTPASDGSFNRLSSSYDMIENATLGPNAFQTMAESATALPPTKSILQLLMQMAAPTTTAEPTSGTVADPSSLTYLETVRAANRVSNDTVSWDANNAAIAAARVDELVDFPFMGNAHKYPTPASGDRYSMQTTARTQGFFMNGPGECIAFGYSSAQEAIDAWNRSPSQFPIINASGNFNVGIAGNPDTGIWVLIVTCAPTVSSDSVSTSSPDMGQDLNQLETIKVDVARVVAPPTAYSSTDDTAAHLPVGVDVHDAPNISVEMMVPVVDGTGAKDDSGNVDGSGYIFEPFDVNADGVPDGYKLAGITSAVQVEMIAGMDTPMPIPATIANQEVTVEVAAAADDSVVPALAQLILDNATTMSPADAAKFLEAWIARLEMSVSDNPNSRYIPALTATKEALVQPQQDYQAQADQESTPADNTSANNGDSNSNNGTSTGNNGVSNNNTNSNNNAGNGGSSGNSNNNSTNNGGSTNPGQPATQAQYTDFPDGGYLRLDTAGVLHIHGGSLTGAPATLISNEYNAGFRSFSDYMSINFLVGDVNRSSATVISNATSYAVSVLGWNVKSAVIE